MLRQITPVRVTLAALAALLFAAYYVPKLSAARYREPIHAALESALGRKVEIGEVRFRLLPAPGFTVSYVRIGEDPAIGAEPAAYVTTLRAVPRLSALFGGPLAFSSVDLDDASLNLTRVDSEAGGVQWNFTSLMRPALLQTFPSVHLHGGRINFKFGQTKSIFYLLDTDVDLWPPGNDKAPWTFRLRAEPARTDRPARGFGSFTGRGEWQPSTNAITLDTKLEKSQLGEVLTLFEGQDPGLRGEISGDAHLAGPIWKIGVEARLAIAEVHSWEQAPPGQRPLPVSLRGVINASGQLIELRATTASGQPPVDLRYRVADYLKRPRWGVTLNFSGVPIAPMLTLGRNLGVAIPAEMRLTGTAEGAVGYSMPDGNPRLDGRIGIAGTTLALGSNPPLRMEAAQLNFSGSGATLAPAAVLNDRNETATVDGTYDFATKKLDVSIASAGMEVASLQRQISIAGAPLLGQATSGIWRGNLHYSSEPAGWTGQLHLDDADLPFEAFSSPLHIASADATLETGSLSLKKLAVKVGELEAQGEYRYDALAPRPHHFRLAIAEANAARLEQALSPTLRRGNIFTYAFNFGRAPQPDWLLDMKADGTVQIGKLEIAGLIFNKARSRVVWDGTQVRLSGLQGAFGTAQLEGTAVVDLRGRAPVYEIAGKAADVPWRMGIVTAEGRLTTHGSGSDLLSNLSATGSFHGRNLVFAQLDRYSSAEGCFDWTWDAANPRLTLNQLALTNFSGTLVGSGEMQNDGELLLHLSDGEKQIQSSIAALRGEAAKPVAHDASKPVTQ